MKRNIAVAPSILAADFWNLEQEITRVAETEATYLHFDVMDGHFVNNISFGVPVLKAIAKKHHLINDVHLMIENVARYLDAFMDAGADIITFHLEAVNEDEIEKLILRIHERGLKVGISLKPKTAVKEILPYLNQIDLVLVMSVEPGFGGQSFIEESLNKISELREFIDNHNLSCLIEVDGGINDTTAPRCIQSGADILVSGSYIFGANDIKESVRKLIK